jgi:GNAT superfamily N-acetyltransferase
MWTEYENFQIDDNRQRIDFATVQSWLSDTYWSPGISREKVEQAANASTIVIGAYRGTEQVAYMRVLSDTVRFAYFADVYVADSVRGRGLGQVMVKFAIDHPLIADVKKLWLRTADAHGVYEKVGFQPLTQPEIWMQLFR